MQIYMINFIMYCVALWEKIYAAFTDSLAGMATSALARGLLAAMRVLTISPKTILQHIINFLPVVGYVGENETQYHELIETMAETLKSTMPDRGAPLPETS